MMERTGTRIDRSLLDQVRKRASEQGRDEEDLIEDAVSRYLREGPARDPKEIFESIDRHQREGGVEPLSEEETMRLAVEEQHTWRRERRERGSAWKDRP